MNTLKGLRRLVSLVYSVNQSQGKSMAHTGSELCYLNAGEALALFKSKKLSPVELMKAVIQRCEDVNPKINATVKVIALN